MLSIWWTKGEHALANENDLGLPKDRPGMSTFLPSVLALRSTLSAVRSELGQRDQPCVTGGWFDYFDSATLPHVAELVADALLKVGRVGDREAFIVGSRRVESLWHDLEALEARLAAGSDQNHPVVDERPDALVGQGA